MHRRWRTKKGYPIASHKRNLGQLLVATTNIGKFRELSGILASCPYELVSLTDINIDVVVEETGETFEENATLKASSYARLSGMITLADDSGLEVQGLNGDPGIRTSRYAGSDATDMEKIAFLLKKLENIVGMGREARFRSVIAVSSPFKNGTLFKGECRGRITKTPRGTHGFGYDPVFLIPELGKTLAELSMEQKSKLSHRGRAARKAAITLNSWARRSSLSILD